MSEAEYQKTVRRTTQRALYTCMLSVIACALMLFGTTYAWFTMNSSSDPARLEAERFDVTVTVNNDNTNLSSGGVIATAEQTEVTGEATPHPYTIKFARTGEGAALGHCAITIKFDSVVTNTSVTYTYDPQTGDQVASESANVTQSSQTRTFYTLFSGDTTTASFTLNLSNCAATVQSIDVSWGGYTPQSGAIGPVKATKLMSATKSAAPQSGVETLPPLEIIGDEESVSFGAPNTISHSEPEKPDVSTLSEEAIAKLLDSGVITQEDVDALNPAEETKTEEAKTEQTDSEKSANQTETTTMGDNNDGGTKSDKPDAGTDNNDSSGSGAGRSGSESSGGGSSAGGSESSGGAGGSGAGESAGGSGESSGTDSSDSGDSGSGADPGDSGTDSGSSGDSGSGTDSGSGDSGTDSGAGE